MSMLETIRLQVMRGHSKEIRRLLLTDRLLGVLRWAEAKGEVTTAALSVWLDCSTQNASMKLGHLYDLGYLNRTERTAESGGIEYVYRCAVERGPDAA